MMTPDVEQIKAALAAVREPCCCDNPACTDSNWSLLMERQVDTLTPTVAALMDDYAADLRAEVERARGDAKAWLDERGNAEYRSALARAERAEADRDAYAAERVRAALLDTAEAIEAHGRATAIFSDRDEGYKAGVNDAADILRDQTGAS